MTRWGLILILACAMTGSVFHIWSTREKPLTGTLGCTAPLWAPLPNTKPAAQRDVEFGPYMADLQRRIKQQWFPPKANVADKIEVVFKVHSNGVMSNLRLVKATGSALASQAALKAVINASPFRPLPDGAPDNIDIRFTFDYNVYKGSGNVHIR